VERDERGFRIALVADELVNAGDGSDLLGVLERAGWGLMMLPPVWYSDEVAGPLLTQIAEQVDEFARHGYDLILVGERAGLSEALSVAGTAVPVTVRPAGEGELAEFLAARPVPPVR
jgi:hypothetical protein